MAGAMLVAQANDEHGYVLARAQRCVQWLPAMAKRKAKPASRHASRRQCAVELELIDPLAEPHRFLSSPYVVYFRCARKALKVFCVKHIDSAICLPIEMPRTPQR